MLPTEYILSLFAVKSTVIGSSNLVSITGDGGNAWGYFGPSYKRLAPKLETYIPYKESLDKLMDVMIEANSNNLIIYNSKMKSVVVDKVGMSIDVLPTVLNLFGMVRK